MEKISENIKAFRESLGWTLEDLSEKSGVSAITIHRIESGKTAPTFFNIAKIAKSFNITISELAGEKDVVVDPKLAHVPVDVLNTLASISDKNIGLVRDVLEAIARGDKNKKS